MAVENLQRDWYVVYSNPHKEEQAQFHLALKGMKSFSPKLYIPAAESRGRICPLFPNYLFVRLHMETECHRIVWTPGVKRIVSFGAEPIPIDESVIQILQQQADEKGIIRAQSKLTCGQEVEISGGPFDGLMGIIQAPPQSPAPALHSSFIPDTVQSITFFISAEAYPGSNPAIPHVLVPNNPLVRSSGL